MALERDLKHKDLKPQGQLMISTCKNAVKIQIKEAGTSESKAFSVNQTTITFMFALLFRVQA